MTKSIWITYAWIDNEDFDVDHIISRVKQAGLDVHFDRRKIVPGQRIWPQIDKAIQSADAWAIIATEASLKSEPCQEELAFALDKALRTRGSDFPLIGIFPKPVARELIPSAIVTRLYVTLQDPHWVERVKAGVERRPPDIGEIAVDPYVIKRHDENTLEIRPRSGRWYPAFVATKKLDSSTIKSAVHGLSEHIPGATITSASEFENAEWKGTILHHAITNLHSIFVTFSHGLPSELAFGAVEGEQFSVKR